MSSESNGQTRHGERGFDAARHRQEDDYLNRWSFAQEIYRIASGGLRDWSVRIGVYGEWGSGKTSVLNFVESMALKDGHLIFRFNPWQFQNADDLWRAFVIGLFSQIEQATHNPPTGKLSRNAKVLSSSVAKVLPTFIKLAKKEAGEACEQGLKFLKKYLSFNEKDLRDLGEAVGDCRLIVTIDDLDRTEARLVPEILFALKEIMDVPGMAFVCAFDPVVVGKVLGDSHSGFGDGLEFLEKIIDYPRWLPEPTKDQLSRLAVADASKFCPHVPAGELSEAVGLLPKNPRAIRQFIRILDLLRHQIQRHHDYEIHWPVLLAANVLKVRFPKISHEILGDPNFWQGIYDSTFSGESKESDLKNLITTKIDKVFQEDLKRAVEKRNELEKCIVAIASRLNAWHGLGQDALTYQFELAESPCAVTWKEFDSLVVYLNTSSISSESTQKWIDNHSAMGGQPKSLIFAELVPACLNRRLAHLDKAASAMPGREMNEHLESARKLLRLGEILMSEMHQDFSQDPIQTSNLFEQVRKYFHWRRTAPYRLARREERKLLIKLFMSNKDAIEPWVEIIGLGYEYGRYEHDNNEWKILIGKFQKNLKERCSRWLINQMLTRSEFVRHVLREEKHGHLYAELFLDLNAPIWTKQRNDLLKSLGTKTGNPTLQNNAYEILSWLYYSASEDKGESKKAKALLSQADFASQLWKACVSESLNPRAVGSLRKAHAFLVANGVVCKTPVWWDQIVKDMPTI